MDTSSANKFYLELKGRTESNPYCAEAEHEDCPDCIKGSMHLKIVKIWHLWIFLEATVALHLFLCDFERMTTIRVLLFSLLPTFLSALLFFRFFDRAVAGNIHDKLERSRDLRTRMAEAMRRVDERQRKCLKTCLFQAQTSLRKFLEEIGEAKECLRGTNKLQACLSGIIRLRDLGDELAIWRDWAEAEKNMFSLKLQNLREAVKSGQITEERFVLWSGELYGELKAVGLLVEKLQDVELDEPRRKDLSRVDTRRTEKALLEFVTILESHSD